jgi:hypothetical protein
MRLEFDDDRLADFRRAVDMGHQAAGRDVADQAELAAAIDDQHADPKDLDVALLGPPFGRCRRLGRKRVAGFHEPLSRQHYFAPVIA